MERDKVRIKRPFILLKNASLNLMIQGSKKYLSPYINEQNLYFKSWPYKSHSYKISTSFVHTLMYSLSLSNTNRMQCINSTLWERKSRTSKSQLLGLWWYSTTNSIKDVFRIVTLTPNLSFLIFNYGMDQNGPKWIKVDKTEPNRQNWPE